MTAERNGLKANRFKQAKPALASLRFKAKVTCSCICVVQVEVNLLLPP